ncbi:MAG: hypothetical protein ACRDN9_20285, partial [Streptosporangiaceae bacterium]
APAAAEPLLPLHPATASSAHVAAATMAERVLELRDEACIGPPVDERASGRAAAVGAFVPDRR